MALQLPVEADTRARFPVIALLQAVKVFLQEDAISPGFAMLVYFFFLLEPATIEVVMRHNFIGHYTYMARTLQAQ